MLVIRESGGSGRCRSRVRPCPARSLRAVVLTGGKRAVRQAKHPPAPQTGLAARRLPSGRRPPPNYPHQTALPPPLNYTRPGISGSVRLDAHRRFSLRPGQVTVSPSLPTWGTSFTFIRFSLSIVVSSMERHPPTWRVPSCIASAFHPL